METALSTFFYCVACVGGTALACLYWRNKRLADLEALLETVRGLAALELNLRLDDDVEARLRSGLNRTLQTLNNRYLVAERRGLEWEKALDSVGEMVCATDTGGHIVRANNAFAKRLGMDVRDVVGKQLQAFIHGHETDPDAECPLALTVKTRRPVASHLGACRLGDKLMMVTTPLERPEGDCVIIAVIHEVVEATSDVASDSLLDLLPCPAIVSDPSNGRIRSFNPAFVREFGRPAEGATIESFVGTDDDEELVRMRKAAFAGAAEGVGVTVRKNDCSKVRCNVTGVVRRTASGAPASMLLTFDPIAPSAPAPNSKAEHEILAAAMESTNDGIIITDLDGVIRRANTKACKIYDRCADEIRGMLLDTLHIGLLDDVEGDNALWDTLRRDGAWTGETLRMMPAGECVPTRIVISLVDGPNASPIAVAVVQDLRAEREMQEEVLRSQKLATLGELSGSITHEISNPLTVVLENAKWLAEDLAEIDVDPQLQRAAAECVQGAKQMQTILNEVRTFAHMGQSGPQHIHFETAVSSALVLAGPAVARVADVVKPADHGPMIYCDPGHLSQVMLNLLKNASHAIQTLGRRGTIRIEYGIDASRGYVRVSDDGPGIPPGVQARLFRAFVTTKERGRGTGFGLRLSAKLIEENNGEIIVESCAGKGATFTIYLPLNAPSEDCAIDASAGEPLTLAPADHWGDDVTMQDLDAESMFDAAHSRDTMPAAS